MAIYRDFWLFRSALGETAENTMPAVRTPFLSVEDARVAAVKLGGEMDILGAPMGGGTLRLVERVDRTEEGQEQPPAAPDRGDSDE